MSALQTDPQFANVMQQGEERFYQSYPQTDFFPPFDNGVPVRSSTPASSESTTSSQPSPTYDPLHNGSEYLSSPTSTYTSTLRVPSSTRPRPANYVPRPRNAFMIFRSEFWANDKISRTIEHDHRHISRIIGHYWNEMPDVEKQVWRVKAEQEKLEHMQRYPGYRFSPGSRTKKPVKRKVKRNGAEELLRCRQVAELLMAGKEGEELENAVLSMENKRSKEPSQPSSPALCRGISLESDNSAIASFARHNTSPARPIDSEPIFRSPLLPPVEIQVIPSPIYPLQPTPAHYGPPSGIHQPYQVSKPLHPQDTMVNFQFPMHQATSPCPYPQSIYNAPPIYNDHSTNNHSSNIFSIPYQDPYQRPYFVNYTLGMEPPMYRLSPSPQPDTSPSLAPALIKVCFRDPFAPPGSARPGSSMGASSSSTAHTLGSGSAGTRLPGISHLNLSPLDPLGWNFSELGATQYM